MYNYRVDFSGESLQRDPQGPARLLQDLRHILQVLDLFAPCPARYREVRGADGSLALWFNFQRREMDRALVAVDLLKLYPWTPVQRPSWSDSEWKQLLD